MKKSYRAVLLCLCATAVIGPAGAALAQPPAANREPTSAAILDLRRHFVDGNINALTFHTIDSIFETRTVKAGPTASPMTTRAAPLNFTYAYKGQQIPAEDALERLYTNGLLIMKDGKVVYERYRNHTGPQTHFLSMSMSKSFTSLLIGLAVQDGAIKSLSDQIVTYVPELRGSAYDGVTIQNALDMKTGVDRSDAKQQQAGTPDAERREMIMIRNDRRVTDEALMVSRKGPPGQVFEYSTLNTTVLGWVLEKATKRRLTDYMSDKLWRPLGAQADGFFMMDGADEAAHPFNGMGFNAQMRDYARLGQMMLDGGKVGGKQVIPAAWVEESVGGKHEPTSPGARQGYHNQWWLDVGTQAYSAQGVGGQTIFIDPATRTVVVRMSYYPPNNREVGSEQDAFLRAVSAWSPK